MLAEALSAPPKVMLPRWSSEADPQVVMREPNGRHSPVNQWSEETGHVIQAHLKELHQLCDASTRLLIIYYSSVWKLLFRVADAIDLRTRSRWTRNLKKPRVCWENREPERVRRGRKTSVPIGNGWQAGWQTRSQRRSESASAARWIRSMMTVGHSLSFDLVGL